MPRNAGSRAADPAAAAISLDEKITAENSASAATAQVQGKSVAAELRQDLRFRRLSERVWCLGPRPCAEAMLVIADGRDVLSVLGSFAEIDPELLDWAGARTWPLAPLQTVP